MIYVTGDTKRNWMFCNPHHLIMAGMDDCDDDIDEDLMELAEHYQPTTITYIEDSDDEKYVQLTIENYYFPEVFK